MKLMGRVFFWLSLLAAGLAMVAPLVLSGASYREAQPAFILAVLATAIFGRIAVPARAAPPGVDPTAHAENRRAMRLFQWVSVFIVLGFASGMEFGVAYTDLDQLRSAAHPNMATLEDVAAGSWTGVIGLCLAGFALLMTLVVKSSRVPTSSPYAYMPPRHAY
jgi:hypothetical protein